MNTIAMRALSYPIRLLFIGVTMFASHAFAQIYHVKEMNTEQIKRYRRSHYSEGMNGAGSGPTKHLSVFCREYLRSRVLTPNDRSPRFKLLPTHSTKLALALSLAEDLRWGSGSDREVIAYSRNRSKILQAPADRLGNTVQIAINFR